MACLDPSLPTSVRWIIRGPLGEFCSAETDAGGEVVRCTRIKGHEVEDSDPARAFHQHLSVGKPIVRWSL